MQDGLERATIAPEVATPGRLGLSTDQDLIGQSVKDPLPGLRKQLADEYGRDVPLETIEKIAEQSLGEFQGARVRDFVPVFAWRRARQLLRRTP